MKTELFHFIKERMKRYPQAIIGDTEGNRWSYNEFLNRTDGLAKQLTRHKYGIICQSELSTALALMACFQAGITAVPISAGYGDVSQKKILENCELSCVLSDTHGSLSEEFVRQEVAESENLNDVALMMCTSGTTGVPKAAMLTDRNILSNLLDIEQYFPLSKTDRILIHRSLCHAAVLVGEFLAALSKGSDIIFDKTEFDPVRTLLNSERFDITVMCGTPTFFYRFCRFAMRRPKHPTLRMIAVSGECMRERTASLICTALPDVLVYHVYGLTEAAPRVSWLPPNLFKMKPLSVGIPLVSEKIKVTNEKGLTVQTGELGELWVYGPNVMKGYYKDRKTTNITIQNNWLKTGDIAYLDEENHLFICGRRDDLIIRAGLNIYPAEIENQLQGEDCIEEVLVRRYDTEIGQKLLFYVVPKSSQVTSEIIFRKCRDKLPPQHWPDKIVITQSLRRSASGKIKRYF